jgi:hypothetical protein
MRADGRTMMERHFALDLPAGRFACNVLVLSLAALALPLAAYLSLRPGVAEMLAQGGTTAARLLLRQVALNGVPVVFAVTWAGFVLHGLRTRPGVSTRTGQMVMLADAPLRLTIFGLLHLVVYVLAADWFGSFGGDRATALRVVAPTLARAAAFENLSGAYLYAVLLASLPAQASASRPPGGRGRAVTRFGLLAWTALCVAAFTAILVAIAR